MILAKTAHLALLATAFAVDLMAYALKTRMARKGRLGKALAP